MDVERLASARTPGSRAEALAVHAAGKRFAALGLAPGATSFRAPVSPSWPPLLGAIGRLAAATLVNVGLAAPALAPATIAILANLGPQPVSSVLRWIPLLGARSRNVAARVPPASSSDDPPLIVVAHVDNHPTDGRPLFPAHRAGAGVVAWALLAVAITVVATGWDSTARTLALTLAVEPVLTIGWLLTRELSLGNVRPGDNASGLAALSRLTELLVDDPPEREVWLVATGAATSGGYGVAAFLRAHPETARVAWVVELDDLGEGEIVIAPARRRLRQETTPPAVVRVVAGAAMDSGDPLDVRRTRRRHSDARAAFARGVPAVSITAGARPHEEAGVDSGNVERAAQIVHRLAHTSS